MKCAIVEDERLSIELLADYAAKIPGLSVEAVFTSPIEAKRWLEVHEVDLLLLDIRLPEFTGLDLLRLLPAPPPAIVVSADPGFALESYDFLILDYLVKPVSLPRFVQALDKASRILGTPDPAPAKAPPTSGQLAVRLGSRVVRIPHDDILWIESFGEYVRIRTPERMIMPLMTMAALEASLPPDRFARTHRSRIVQIDRVESLEADHVVVAGSRHPVGRRQKAALRRRLQGGASGHPGD